MRKRKQQSRPQYDLRETRAHIRDAYDLIAKLLAKVRSLPPLQPDGSSDCPDAEELYAQREEIERKLRGWVDLLRQHLGLVVKEIQRCKLNSNVIEAATTDLNHDDPKHAFTEAEAAQAANTRDGRVFARKSSNSLRRQRRRSRRRPGTRGSPAFPIGRRPFRRS